MDFELYVEVFNGNISGKVLFLGEEGIFIVDEDWVIGIVFIRIYICYLIVGVFIFGVFLWIIFNIIFGGKFVKFLNCLILIWWEYMF